MEAAPDLLVDSHVHHWDPGALDYPWLDDEPRLRRTFLPQDLEREVSDLDGLALRSVVVVQADCLPHQSLAEATWIHRLADDGAPVLGLVAQAALERGGECAAQLLELAALPLVAGVRRLLQDEPPGFSLTPGFVDGVLSLAAHGLVMDLCVRHHQLREMVELVQRCPQVDFVLDHLGKPVLDPGAFAPWADDLALLAALPNVSCKLSGLGTEAREHAPAPATFLPWLRHALEVFGPGRCLFGSDWPVMTSALSYARWCETVVEAISDLPPPERTRVLSGNALAVYDPVNRGARAKES